MLRILLCWAAALLLITLGAVSSVPAASQMSSEMGLVFCDVYTLCLGVVCCSRHCSHPWVRGLCVFVQETLQGLNGKSECCHSGVACGCGHCLRLEKQAISGFSLVRVLAPVGLQSSVNEMLQPSSPHLFATRNGG